MTRRARLLLKLVILETVKQAEIQSGKPASHLPSIQPALLPIAVCRIQDHLSSGPRTFQGISQPSNLDPLSLIPHKT